MDNAFGSDPIGCCFSAIILPNKHSSIEMGAQTSLCGPLTAPSTETLAFDSTDDPNLTCADVPIDPLKKFLCSPNTLEVKTLRNLICHSRVVPPRVAAQALSETL
jgi:hypothetical protein